LEKLKMSVVDEQAKVLEKDWSTNPRWKGVERTYSAADVVRLRGSVQVEHTLARRGAERLWKLVNEEAFVPCLGALTGKWLLMGIHRKRCILINLFTL
jgi:isocitrate lyase